MRGLLLSLGQIALLGVFVWLMFMCYQVLNFETFNAVIERFCWTIPGMITTGLIFSKCEELAEIDRYESEDEYDHL